MLPMVAQLLRNRSGRGVSATTCAALFAFFAVTVTAFVTFALARWGSVGRWPVAYRAALVLVSVGGSCSWWWINASVEGRILFSLAPNRGVTVADLLPAPAMLLALFVIVVTAWPRVRSLV